MSSIPNSAMPHAKPSQNSSDSQESGGGVSAGLDKVKQLVRDNPKTAIAAGAAVVAGVAAAVAIPQVMASRSETGSKSKK
ncbi:MAG: hypothetical protein E6G94_06805 [Alphaproteobacteria bacterium]|nr:MAG: hypothetical protein E6G94_06805 [Alphaproteobacteria bacterium]